MTEMAQILLVDDSAYFRMKLREILEEGGHSIVGEAGDGFKAQVLYTQFKPDLVTMDISMPTVGGIEGVKKILQMDSKAKIIMVSALGQRDFVLEALKLGAKHFVVKPIEKDKLIEVVTKVLGSK